MADGDAKRPGESRDDLSASKPAKPASSHDDMGVHVSRDLNASGSVARGYGANMSKLNFSARAIPRAEGADGDPALVRPVVAAEVPVPQAPAAPVDPAAESASTDGSVVSWLTGLFTRR